MNIEELLDKVQQLPSIPKVVQELIQSFGGDDYDIDEIGKKLAMDQVLTAKVLRLANSAKYGGSRQIASVNEAVVRLGSNALRTLVLASGFVSTFKAPPGFDLKGFWKESFAVAETSQWLAKYMRADKDAAFTAGMLSNIGQLLIDICIPDRAQEIDRVVARGGERSALELEALGFTSAEVGARVASMWKFPKAIVAGIEHYGQPDSAEEGTLAHVIFVARYLVAQNASNATDAAIIEDFPSQIVKAAGGNLVSLLDNLPQSRELNSGIEALLD